MMKTSTQPQPIAQMQVYRVDLGPHRSGSRWGYIASDGEYATDQHATPKAAQAAWAAGKKSKLEKA